MRFAVILLVTLITSASQASMFSDRLVEKISPAANPVSKEYQVHVKINSQGLVDSRIVPVRNDPLAQQEDFEKGEIANRGDLRLEIIDVDQVNPNDNYYERLATLKTQSGLPIFDASKNYTSNFAHTSILVRLVNADGYWLAPWTWGRLGDQKFDIVSASLSSQQNSTLKSLFVSQFKKVEVETKSSTLVKITTTEIGKTTTSNLTTEQYLKTESELVSGMTEVYLIELTRT